MIKALSLLTVTIPALFMPVSNLVAPDPVIEEPLTRTEQMVADLDALDNCEAQSVSVYFHDALIESHSAEFLNSAIYLASHCDLKRIQIVRYTTPHADEYETDLSIRQAEEIKAFVEYHEVEAEVNVSALNAAPDEKYEDGRAAFIRFDMKNTARTS